MASPLKHNRNKRQCRDRQEVVSAGCDLSCRLCRIILTPTEYREDKDRQLAATDHFEWIPGLGAFVEGYSLVLAKRHDLNTGCFSESVIDELEQLVGKVKSALRQIYGKPSVVFEHGAMAADRLEQRAGGCIEHHHLHIMPVDLPAIPDRMRKDLPKPTRIEGLKTLREYYARGVPYLYFQSSEGEEYMFEAPALPRQYMRVVLAAEMGCPQEWDWRQRPHKTSVHSFVSALL